MEISYRVNSVGSLPAENPYFPYLAALQSGVIRNPEKMATELETSPGIDIINGYIPNSRGAGIIAMQGGLMAFDLVTIEFQGTRLEIMPAPKSAVDHDSGRITGEGAIVLQKPDGRLSLAGVAIDVSANPWLVNELSGKRPLDVHNNIAVVALSSMEVPEYEIADIDSQNGIIQAKERIRYI